MWSVMTTKEKVVVIAGAIIMGATVGIPVLLMVVA